MAFTAAIVHLMRECSGMGMMDCKAAAVFADERLGGDYVTALLMADANKLAVNIRSRDPAVSDKHARLRWNFAHAVGLRDSKISSPDWSRLAEINGPFFEGPLPDDR